VIFDNDGLAAATPAADARRGVTPGVRLHQRLDPPAKRALPGAPAMYAQAASRAGWAADRARIA